ncbi:hypothetical protein AB0C95_11565 [Streptomyces caniferus]|uniref:hypothetical protein n=1 Tax=Streptomyces caniferus TaxID=285557 RepID=UPI0033F1DA40
MRGVPYLELEDLPALLERLEHYYDAVPRSGARPENFGALTLFVRAGRGWPFSVRPALGRRGEVRAADVHRVRLRQRELGVPESFEWVAETAPALRAAVEQAGLFVRAYPLMALGPDAPTPDVPPVADGVVLRTVGPGDPALPSVLAIPRRGAGGRCAIARRGDRLSVRGDEDATRLYARLGFRSVATALIAGPVD